MAFNQVVRGAQKSFEFPIQFKDVEHSESIRPHGKFQLAPWLPVGVFDPQAREYIVLPVGKAVKLDISGHLVPAGLVDGDSVTYTASDISSGTIDVSTGVPVVAAATVAIPAGQIPAFGRVVGVLSHNARQSTGAISAVASGAAFIYTVEFETSIKDYGLYNYPGSDNIVTLLCDYVVRVPYSPVDTMLSPATILASATPLSALARFVTHAHFDTANGDIEPGSFVKADDRGNYIVADPTFSDDMTEVIGHVLWVRDYDDKSALSMVRSPGTGTFGATQGNATSGLDKSIHLCTDGVLVSGATLAAGLTRADLTKMVGINLLK